MSATTTLKLSFERLRNIDTAYSYDDQQHVEIAVPPSFLAANAAGEFNPITCEQLQKRVSHTSSMLKKIFGE